MKQEENQKLLDKRLFDAEEYAQTLLTKEDYKIQQNKFEEKVLKKTSLSLGEVLQEIGEVKDQ